MSRDYDEKFIDEDLLAEPPHAEGDFSEDLFGPDESNLNMDSKKMQRLCKVGVRRKVEEILERKKNKDRYSDPFDEYSE